MPKNDEVFILISMYFLKTYSYENFKTFKNTCGFSSKISTPKTRFSEFGSLYRVYSPVTTSSQDKEENMKKGAGEYSLNRVFH